MRQRSTGLPRMSGGPSHLSPYLWLIMQEQPTRGSSTFQVRDSSCFDKGLCYYQHSHLMKRIGTDNSRTARAQLSFPSRIILLSSQQILREFSLNTELMFCMDASVLMILGSRA